MFRPEMTDRFPSFFLHTSRKNGALGRMRVPDDSRRLYRHTGVALLRAAVWPTTRITSGWPDPADLPGCLAWLEMIWSNPQFADAVGHASPSLRAQAMALLTADTAEGRPDKQVRRATVASARYLLRATGRPTPFGLFAGVAPVVIARPTHVRWGTEHRPIARADSQWLVEIIDQLHANLEVLEELKVQFTNLAVRRGDRLDVPQGAGRVTIRDTPLVRAVRDYAASPILFSVLADKLTETFGGAYRPRVVRALAELVRQGFVLSSLRAPGTTVDPLAHLLQQLRMAPMLDDLRAINTALRRHNDSTSSDKVVLSQLRSNAVRQQRNLSDAGRTPLAVDMALDCAVQIPDSIADEAAHAASALLRLTRYPTGRPAWRDYHSAFCDRYGIGALVPLVDVLDPGAGLGYPAGYPGSVLAVPTESVTARDGRLLALAWQAAAKGNGEILLTDHNINEIAGGQLDGAYAPPHVEIAARIHAASKESVDRGDYLLTVAPARAGGVLTSRFTPTTTGAGLDQVYRDLPLATKGALAVQMSFPPAYSHAENICRVPAYLPHLLSLGEFRAAADEQECVPVDDLALVAARTKLHLVSIARRQVIEPQVLHALDLDKQPPPLARFLAHLTRGFAAAFTVLDWGLPAEALPYLPRVRYRRAILAPARWRLTRNCLPPASASDDMWRAGLDQWRGRWHWPVVVDLREDDRTIRLTLDEPLHAAILRTHLARKDHAVLTEPLASSTYAWFDNHAHDIAFPLVTTQTPAPSPLVGPLPIVRNRQADSPAGPDARWLYAKIHTHPELFNDLIAHHLPDLLAELTGPAYGDAGAEPSWWFIRYRSAHETDHLRLRLRVPEPSQYGAYAAAVGAWSARLLETQCAGRLVLDTYYPEVGRYGSGPAMTAAETVFVTDSRVAAATLRQAPPTTIAPAAMVAVNMVHIATGLLGFTGGMTWLATQPTLATPSKKPGDRTIATRAIELVRSNNLPDLPMNVLAAWRERNCALKTYREHLTTETDIDTVLESLLHMHHNRAVGVDPDSEKACRRLARQAARAWASSPANTT
ncbi:lantibiotic dehydratase [Fodinicola feengrottensis]|uniref:Lantibiotic dehydratase n=2 Tax=Fodinicola feengrottensis TaxID=435914 RepID=A0ABP4SQ44_9ACTN